MSCIVEWLRDLEQNVEIAALLLSQASTYLISPLFMTQDTIKKRKLQHVALVLEAGMERIRVAFI